MINELRRYTRSRRARFFRSFIQAFPRPLRIIDLGGTVKFWEAWGIGPADRIHLTLINNHKSDVSLRDYPNAHSFIDNLSVDARSLTSDDLAGYDLIFSNSFIEHLTSWEDQKVIAGLITQSGKPYFVQTPNKYAPVDPHFPRPYVPFFAVYPRWLQARLLTIDTLGGGVRHPSVEDALARLRYYNLLGLREMRQLFPGAELTMERPFGVPMSIIASLPYEGAMRSRPKQGSTISHAA